MADEIIMDEMTDQVDQVDQPEGGLPPGDIPPTTIPVAAPKTFKRRREGIKQEQKQTGISDDELFKLSGISDDELFNVSQKKSPIEPSLSLLEQSGLPSQWVKKPDLYSASASYGEQPEQPEPLIKKWMVEKIANDQKISQEQAIQEIQKRAPIKTAIDAHRDNLKTFGVNDAEEFIARPTDELAAWYRNKKEALDKELSDLQGDIARDLSTFSPILDPKRLNTLLETGDPRKPEFTAKSADILRRQDLLNQVKKQLLDPKTTGEESNAMAAGLKQKRLMQPGIYDFTLSKLVKNQNVPAMRMLAEKFKEIYLPGSPPLPGPPIAPAGPSIADEIDITNPAAVDAWISRQTPERLSSLLPEGAVFEMQRDGFQAQAMYQANISQQYADNWSKADELKKKQMLQISERRKTAKTPEAIAILDQQEQAINDAYKNNPDVQKYLTATANLLRIENEARNAITHYPNVLKDIKTKEAIEKNYNDRNVTSRQILNSPLPFSSTTGSYGLFGGFGKGFVGVGVETMKSLGLGLAAIGWKDKDQAYWDNYQLTYDFDTRFYTPSGAQAYTVTGYEIPEVLKQFAQQANIDPSEFQAYGKPITKFNPGGMLTAVSEMGGNVMGQAVLTKGVGGVLKAVPFRLGQTALAKSLQANPLLESPLALGAEARQTAAIMGSTFAATYAQNYQAALQAGLSQGDAENYAGISSFGTAFTELINPDVQYLTKGASKTEQQIQRISHTIKNTKLSPSQRFLVSTVEGLTHVGKETVEEVADVLKSHGLDAAYQIDTNGKSLAEDIKQTVIQTTLGMIPFGIAGGWGHGHRLQREALWEVGINPASVNDYYSRSLNEITDPAERQRMESKAIDAMKIANTMQDIISKTPTHVNGNPSARELTLDERMNIAAGNFKARKLRSDAAAAKNDKPVMESLREQAAEEDKKTTAIITGTAPVYIINGQSIPKDSFLQFLQDPDFLKQKEVHRLAVLNDPATKAVLDEAMKDVKTTPQKEEALNKVDATITTLEKSIQGYEDKIADLDKKPQITDAEKGELQETKELLDTAKKELDIANSNKKEIKKSAKVDETPALQNVINDNVTTGANIQQKADIGKRREAELEANNVNRLLPVNLDDNAADPLRDKQNEINAKYDAELAALEPAPAQPVQETPKAAAQPSAGPTTQLQPNQPLPWKPMANPQNKNKTNPVGENIKENFASAPKVVSKNVRTIKLPGTIPGVGRSLRGRLALVPHWSLTPSHNPETFANSQGFPLLENGENPNDRDYSLAANQQQVFQHAINYDQRALDNYPTVTPDGVVIDGNDRTMAGQLAVQTERNFSDQEYLDELKNRLSDYGFTAEDYNHVAQQGHPRLVFVTENDVPLQTETFHAFNVPTGKGKSVVEKAVTVRRRLETPSGKSVMNLIMDEIDEVLKDEDSISKLYTKTNALKKIFEALQNGNLLQSNEVADYYNVSTGTVTEHGKDYLESLLLSNIVNEKNLVYLNEPGVKNYRQKLIGAIRNLTAIENLDNPELRIAEPINQAISLKYDLTKYEGSPAQFLTGSLGMEGTGENLYSPEDVVMYFNLEQNAKQFKEFTGKYLGIASLGGTNQGLMFAEEKSNNRAEVLERLAQTYTDEQQRILQAAESAYQRKQSLRAKEGSGNAPGSTGKPGTGSQRPVGTAQRRTAELIPTGKPAAQPQPAGTEQTVNEVPQSVQPVVQPGVSKGQQPGQEQGQPAEQPAAQPVVTPPAAPTKAQEIIAKAKAKLKPATPPAAPAEQPAAQPVGRPPSAQPIQPAQAGPGEFNARNLPAPTGEFEVVDVFPYSHQWDNVFRPDQQLKFNQGTIYEPVRIIGHPDMISLIQMGSRIAKKRRGQSAGFVDDAERNRLQSQYGITATAAYEKARQLAKDNRDKNEERFIVLGKPITAEQQQPAAPVVTTPTPAVQPVQQPAPQPVAETDEEESQAKGLKEYNIGDYVEHIINGAISQVVEKSGNKVRLNDIITSAEEPDRGEPYWISDTRVPLYIPAEDPTARVQAMQAEIDSYPKTIAGKKPNPHGVFDPEDYTQSYVLKDKRKGWQGVPRAAVYTIQLENGNWISSYEYHLPLTGSSSGLSVNNEQFPTSAEAVNNALAKLRTDIKKQGNPSDYVKWMDEVAAQQSELALDQPVAKPAATKKTTSDQEVLDKVRSHLEEVEKIPFDQRTDGQHADFIRWKFVSEFAKKGVPLEQLKAAVALMDARAEAFGNELVRARDAGKVKKDLSAEESGNIFFEMPDLQDPDYDTKMKAWNKKYGHRKYDWYRQIEDIRNGEFQQATNQPQDAKGAIETLENGRKIIHALAAPDFSTTVHEIAHVFEDELSNEDRQVVQDWAGTSKWNVKTSEAFARGFERYLRDGIAPNEQLKRIFQQAKQWLTNIYQTLTGSPIAKKISPEVKNVFDRLFTGAQATPVVNKPGTLFQEASKQEQIGKIADEIRDLSAAGLTPDEIANAFVDNIPGLTAQDIQDVLTLPQAQQQQQAPPPPPPPPPGSEQQQSPAERMRSMKLGEGYTLPTVFDVPVKVFNDAVDIMANALDQGVSVQDAISLGLQHIQSNGGGNAMSEEIRKAITQVMAGGRIKGRASVGGEMQQNLDTSRKLEREYNETADGPVEPEPANPADNPAVGLDVRAVNAARVALGLEPIEKNPTKTRKMANEESNNAMAGGVNIESILQRILQGGGVSDTESHIVGKYYASKVIVADDAKWQLTKALREGNIPAIKQMRAVFDDAQKELEYVSQVHYQMKSMTGRTLKGYQDIIKNNVFNDYSYANMTERVKHESNFGVEPDEVQTEETEQHWEAIRTAEQAYKAHIEQLNEKNSRLQAELELERLKNKNSKEAKEDNNKAVTKKKSNSKYNAARDKIREILRKKLGNADDTDAADTTVKFQAYNTNSGPVPYLDEDTLAELSPLVNEMMDALLLDPDGPKTQDAIVEYIRQDLQESAPQLTNRNVRDMLTGYGLNIEKKTRPEWQREKAQIKVQMKLMSELEDLLSGNEPPKTIKEKRQQNEAVDKLKAKIKELRDARGIPATEAIDKVNRQLAARLRTVNKNIQDKVFADKKSTAPPLDDTGKKLRNDLFDAKQKFEKAKEKWRLQALTTGETIGHHVDQVLGTIRSIRSSVDFSAVLRQGFMLGIIHPLEYGNMLWKSIKWAFSQKSYDNWHEKTALSEMYRFIALPSGLSLADQKSPTMEAREEAFRANLLEKFPVVGHLMKGSERAYAGGLNVLRYNVFEQGAKQLLAAGFTMDSHPEKFKSIANFINHTTGRGDLTKLGFENSSKALNRIFFSPRFIASRLNTFNYMYWKGLEPKQRWQMAASMASFIGFNMLLMKLASAAGGDTDDDPTSATFMTLQTGNTKIDFLAGYKSYINFFARVGAVAIGAPGAREPGRMKEAAFEFAQGKFAPVSGVIVNNLFHQNAVGEPSTLGTWPGVINNLIGFAPMSYETTKELIDEHGFTPKAMALTGLSLFGANVSTYKSKAKKVNSFKRLNLRGIKKLKLGGD